MKKLSINRKVNFKLNDIADVRDWKNDWLKYFWKNSHKNSKEIEGKNIPSIEESVVKESDDENNYLYHGEKYFNEYTLKLM